ncbi:MAG: hypothetical protein R6V40_01250 [Candidatus Moraniibacteriota bacterium]
MEVIKVSNLKNHKCEKIIARKLREVGASKVEVDFENNLVLFEGDRKRAIKALAESGHPEEGGDKGKKWLYKTKAYLYCLVE